MVVHELAHQWYGDSLAVRTLAATSGSTRASRPTPSGCGASTKGAARAQEIFDLRYAAIPADDPFWR